MVRQSLGLFAAVAFFGLTGFGAKHSQVETKTVVKGEQLEIEVLVKPEAGMQLTKEGPWQLSFTQAPGLKLDMPGGKFVDKKFDEALPGFKVLAPLDPAAKSGKIDYQVKAFVCTNDKKQCFPQQHSGSIEWKRS